MKNHRNREQIDTINAHTHTAHFSGLEQTLQ